MMEESYRWLILVAGVVLILLVLDRVGLWMEKRGWIYYRRVKPKGSSLGNAFLEIESIVQPSKQHVIEARIEEHDEESDSGDPPEAGENRHSVPL